MIRKAETPRFSVHSLIEQGAIVKIYVQFLCIVLFLNGCGSGSNNSGAEQPLPAPAPIEMDAVLDDFIANNSNISSVAMLAVKDGEIFYSHSAGFFDVVRTKAPTQSTLYKTSSIAKLIIAISVMQQVELGLLDIDQLSELVFASIAPLFAD